MTLVSILDSLRQNLNLRNELRENLEKLYPGMFNFTKKYYIKVEDWDARSIQVLKIFTCLLDIDSKGRYIDKSNPDFIPFGLLIGREKLCIVDKEDNYSYRLEKSYIEDIKNVSKVIDIEDIISEITLFTENFYYNNRDIVVSGTSFIDSIDLIENNIIFRVFLRKRLEKVYSGIMDSSIKNIYYIPQTKENEFIIYRIYDLLKILYNDSKGIGSTKKGIIFSGLSCHINVWKPEHELSEKEKEINDIIDSGKCKIIEVEEIVSTIELITKEYIIWKK